jgi:hypothetical protein
VGKMTDEEESVSVEAGKMTDEAESMTGWSGKDLEMMVS